MIFARSAHVEGAEPPRQQSHTAVSAESRSSLGTAIPMWEHLRPTVFRLKGLSSRLAVIPSREPDLLSAKRNAISEIFGSCADPAGNRALESCIQKIPRTRPIVRTAVRSHEPDPDPTGQSRNG